MTDERFPDVSRKIPSKKAAIPHSYSEAVSLWGGKPYYGFNAFVQNTFHEKVYKIAVDGGFTCPNRDNTLGNRGCIFCSQGGSGDFAARRGQDFNVQFEEGRQLLKNKHTGSRYIAYFQAYTNTYAPVPVLEKIFSPALAHSQVAALSIATRPDCLDEEKVRLLARFAQVKPLWIELGLQTIHEGTAAYIRRGYDLSCFDRAVRLLRKYGLDVIVHTILGLPGETFDQMEETARYLSALDIQGIKPQLLHVLKGTDLAVDYARRPFHILTLEEYTRILIRCLEVLPPDMVIHRITGDGPKKLLIQPLWSGHKKYVMNYIHRRFKELQTWQGKRFQGKSPF